MVIDMINLRNDYCLIAHDKILEALKQYNDMTFVGYGLDEVSEEAKQLIRKEKYDIKVEETPVGFKYISKSMRENDALFGGEVSGGMTMRNYIPSKDSFFSISMILDAMAITKKSLSELIKEVKAESYVNGSIDISNKSITKLIKIKDFL